jgi:hypothetical protein
VFLSKDHINLNTTDTRKKPDIKKSGLTNPLFLYAAFQQNNPDYVLETRSEAENSE